MYAKVCNYLKDRKYNYTFSMGRTTVSLIWLNYFFQFPPGSNIPTEFEIFTPRFKYLHNGLNIYTSVEIFEPRWEYLNWGRNILTSVEIFD